jgi:hypothetical protein
MSPAARHEGLNAAAIAGVLAFGLFMFGFGEAASAAASAALVLAGLDALGGGRR